MLIYVYEIEKMVGMSIVERAEESGRIISEAMEHGVYPFQRIVRDNRIDAMKLMN